MYTQPRNDVIKNIDLRTKNILEKISYYDNLSNTVLTGSVPLPKGTKGSIERSASLDPTVFSLANSEKHTNKLLAFVNDGVKLKWLWTTTKCKYADKHKVVVSVATNKYFLGNVITLGPNSGVSRSNMLILVKNQEEALIYKKYLDSKFVKFIIKNVKFNDVVNTKTNSWNYIPVPPIDQWLKSGMDIYGYFKLKNEEIDIIENLQ